MTAAQESQEPSETPAPSTIPIVNNETRVFVLSYTNPGKPIRGQPKGSAVPREVVTHDLVPGVNYVPVDTVKKCLRPGDIAPPLSIQDPTKANEHAAIELAKQSRSANALQTWRESETRERVLRTIDEQLAPS